MGWGPISGGVGGGRSTFNAGVFADLAALNVWGAANLNSLFNNSTRFTIATIGSGVIFEWSGEDTPTSYPAGGSWTLRFQAGGDGIPPFESEGARDVFFNTPGNEALIKTGLPVEVNIGEGGVPTVTNFVWTGPNNPADYISNDPRWQVAQFRVSNGTLFVGPGMQVSNGVQALGLTKPTGQKALSLQLEYDDSGSRLPFYPSLGAEQTLDVNLLFDAAMPDPYELNYTTFGNNLTNDFIFRASEAGEVRVRYWLGNDDTGTLIFDERRTITADEIGSDINFGIGNAYLLAQGTQLFVRSEGVTLLGTVVSDPSSPFDGQNLLYFRSLIQPYTEVDFMSSGDVISSGVTTTAADSPTLAPTATNQQLVNQAIDGAVATLQNTIFNSGRSFVRFNDGFTIDNTNLATFEDKNIIYTAKNDKPLDGPTRPDVFLPTDADIAAAGESYPITFEFTHLGGTTRSTTTNVVRFFFDGAIIGQILRDDAAVIVKTGVGVDYEISTGTFNPGDTILPTGVFNLNVDTPITNIADIATEFAGVTIVAGDAYLVETGGVWSGLTVPDNSILVAVVSSPSLADSAANNDWLLLDNPRVNAKSAALLANFDQNGILFEGTRNIQVDPSNVFEFTAEATGTPQTREIGTNSQGAGRSITYANVPIQFADLVGGRLMINLNFNVTSVSGFAPAFTSVRLQYPGGIEFSFPVNGAPINGNYIAAIDIPPVDYTSALNQDCTLTLFL